MPVHRQALSVSGNLMRLFIIINLILLILVACQNRQSEEQPLKDLTPEPLENYHQATFEEAFFKKAHYNYAPDSTKYYYSAETIVLSDTAKHYLRTCGVKLVGDTLLFRLTDSPFSKNGYDLRYFKLLHGNGQTFIKLYFGGDTIHQVPIYTIVTSSYLMNKKVYQKGDSIKGKIALTALVWPLTKDDAKKDTLNIYGLLKTIVE